MRASSVTAAWSSVQHGMRALVRLEPRYVVAIKGLLYAVSLVFYVYPLSTFPGIAAAVSMVAVAMYLARKAHRYQLRALVAVVGGPALLVAAALVGDRILDSPVLVGWLGPSISFVTADIVIFGLAAFCSVFVLRSLSHRGRAFSLLEVFFVAGSVAVALAAHRNRMLNRPRIFSDWAWSVGIDPTMVLIGIGSVATLLAVLLFLREQRLLKLITTVMFLLIVGALFVVVGDKRLKPQRATDSLGLSSSGGEGSGKDSLFRDDYGPRGPPEPVAVAILRDDYAPPGGLFYLRQRVLSHYNGHHLVASRTADRDVITRFPRSSDAITGMSEQHREHHTRVPTTMYLVVDHPQPPALTAARSLTLVDNPNPQQFVAAYEAQSDVLSVSLERLFGRESIPKHWSRDKQQHYTEIPDDPRYASLADIIVRKMDPRFTGDDLARALAIKRYLEKQGFYTRKTKYSSHRDPTAAFLFGSMRGYCVHFAHAAVYLLRSQGLAARVALGYAVQTNKRSGGSSVLVMGDRAHAWPEIHIEGVGWVTFDIYPEKTDLPPPVPIDYDLERLLGELARNDPNEGIAPASQTLTIPWAPIGRGSLLLLASLFLIAYMVKFGRRYAPLFRDGSAYCRCAYVSVLDQLSELGHARRAGETRERHAKRLTRLSPHLVTLTQQHLALVFSRHGVTAAKFRESVRTVQRQLREATPLQRRLLAWLHPVAWLWTR